VSVAAILLLLAVVGVVAATVSIVLFYKTELGRARAEISRGVRVAHTSAGPIEFAERGFGIPLLTIHGAGGGYDQGLANVVDLVGDGFRLIAPSRFGYLGTPIPADTSPAGQADAHAALLSELKVSKVIIVGVSAGARSAVELAIRHPGLVAGLILISPGTYAPTSPVAVDGSRTSGLVLWLVNTGADFAWWVIEKTAPSILIRFIGVQPALFAASPRDEQERVMGIVRNIKPPTSWWARTGWLRSRRTSTSTTRWR
jgi:2-hydroxy-6-oxonona-2,4-dienedioate hydrolase